LVLSNDSCSQPTQLAWLVPPALVRCLDGVRGASYRAAVCKAKVRGAALGTHKKLAASEPRIKLQLGKYLFGSESIAKEAARSGLIPTESYELRSCIG
jgi:hypothetical protein